MREGRTRMAVKFLCLDIDGTILDSRKELTDRTRQAVAFVRERGVKVFLASGRSLPGLKELLDRLDLAKNCICMNGALVYADGKEIRRSGLASDMVEEILETAAKYDSQVFFAGVDFNLTNKPLEGKMADAVRKGSLRGDYIIRTNPSEFRTEVKRLEGQILKAGVKELEESNFQRMREDLEAFGNLHIAKSDTHFVDINSARCTKWLGVKAAADYLGIPICDVMCIGDNENDKEMIAKAGIGVAMGNADPCVKRVAYYVTGTNDEDGAADAIHYFL